ELRRIYTGKSSHLTAAALPKRFGVSLTQIYNGALRTSRACPHPLSAHIFFCFYLGGFAGEQRLEAELVGGHIPAGGVDRCDGIVERSKRSKASRPNGRDDRLRGPLAAGELIGQPADLGDRRPQLVVERRRQPPLLGHVAD